MKNHLDESSESSDEATSSSVDPSSEKATDTASTDSSNGPLIFLKAVVFTALFLLLFFVISGAGVFLLARSHWIRFSETSGLTWKEARGLIQSGLQATPRSQDGYVLFLLLGTDSLQSRGDIPPLTDTMMTVSLDLESGSIVTLPIPRDTWSDAYQTKLNALYSYGFERYPDEPERFPTEVLEEMLGVSIQHTVVISLEELQTLINLLDGIEVEVPTSFVDDRFPLPEVDMTTETDPDKLYKTVTFEAGKQIMSGETALEYIRSRKSEDDQGTDLARSSRQQDVITALVEKLRARSTLTNPEMMGRLYAFYDSKYADVLEPTEIIALGRTLFPIRNSISLSSATLPTYDETLDDTSASVSAVLVHPPVDPGSYQGQWVYIPSSKEMLQTTAQNLLTPRSLN